MIPIVSVLILTYKHADFIEQCINSVLSQKTDFFFEIIIGEDDSTDGTREICLDYSKKYPDRIRLFLRSRKDVIYINGQPTGRFNFLETVKAADGEFIAICEGDDYWADDFKLQKQVDFLQNQINFSGCYHDTVVIYEDSSRNKHLFRENLPREISSIETIAIKAPFHTSSFLFRKNALQLPDFFEKVVSADMALFSIVSAKGSLGKIENTLSVYRKHAGGITSTALVKNNFHKNRIELINYLNYFHEKKFNCKVKQVTKFHESQMHKNCLLRIIEILKIGLLKKIFNG